MSGATDKAQEMEMLRADLARFDADFSCEGCGAPLWVGDDFVSAPDGCRGCWATMTDVPSSRPRPCYAYRVGKPDANAATIANLPIDATLLRDGVAHFIDAIRKADPMGSGVMVAYHPNGDWSVYNRGVALSPDPSFRDGIEAAAKVAESEYELGHAYYDAGRAIATAIRALAPIREGEA